MPVHEAMLMPPTRRDPPKPGPRDSLNDESRLLVRSRNGDHEAFGELVQRNQRRLWLVCRQYLGADEADAALARVGLDAEAAARPIAKYSRGMLQRIGLAQALIHEPDLVFLDEPTASLDFGNQVRVLERLAQLAAQGIAVLFSTHDPDHAFLCAQRALLLAEGRVLALGPPREVIRSDTLERLYRVSVRIVQTADGAHSCVPSLGGRS